MAIEQTYRTRSGDHLVDLERELADWLRARTGWPESMVNGACRLAADATAGSAWPVAADADLEDGDVHLHVGRCAELDRVTEVPGAQGRLSVSAHGGDVVLHTC